MSIRNGELSIGDRILLLRAALGKKQKDFAQELGTSASYVSDIEKGKSKAGEGFIESLYRTYKVNINWVMSGDGDMFLQDPRTSMVAEDSGIYIKEGVLKKICQMVLEMDEEEQRDLLKHIKKEEFFKKHLADDVKNAG